jgi:predicted Fe-Mo cluster-binding NifX family protein
MAQRLLYSISMRIAMPYWLGRVSPVFDVADCMLVIDIEDGRETKREQRALFGSDPFERAKQIRGAGVDLLICGALSKTLETAISGRGVEVMGFICGDVEEVIEAFKEGCLAGGCFEMPGRGTRRRQRQQGRA